MAGAKINTKAKGKDDKSKANKSVTSNSEEQEDHDFSLLRKPILTSITGFTQARKIFDVATEELKTLLANECDLLYECKVCRNIFRSLANFISHKRVYCKEKFNSTIHSHFVKNTSAANELLKIQQMEEAYQESLKVTEPKPNENDDRIPLTKDLTGIMEKLTKIKGRYNFDEQQVTLQRIPNSSVAVFQSHSEENKCDTMLAQVQELDNIISQDNAVLQRDGSFNIQSSSKADKIEDSDNVIQISDDEDSDDGRVPKCKICDMPFSTQKTLRFHMKYKHLESRLVYPCPDCLEIFSTSWSVFRHLYKVHRKSAAQIRRLRESIQAKAFRMNNPPAFYEKKKNVKPTTPLKITEEERLDQENQAWMDNMEGDGELPRCGGCGRTFERRAALAAHTHTCQPRSRALARRPQEKKIEIQIRKDYNKGPPNLNLMPKTESNENKLSTEETQTTTKGRAEKVSEPIEKNAQLVAKTLEPVVKIPEPDEEMAELVEKTTEPIQKNPDPSDNKNELVKTNSELTEKKPETLQSALEEATMDIMDEKSSDAVESPEKSVAAPQTADKKPKFRLPFSHQIEKSNLLAFKQRMQPDINLEGLLCKKCDSKHANIPDLFEHMAGHYKWIRYACKLCNFKNYDFEKLPEHVKIVHKLKGDSDFYFSTVKAIDGPEALELAEPVEESDANEESSESRRPSRCSSDSSRLSDDSSSSSTRVESGSRKRKIYQNRTSGKRKKDSAVNDETDDVKDSDTSMDKTMDNNPSSNVKTFEENSSDMEDIEEKMAKRNIINEMSTVTSRRPVRKKTKPKNEDFEYDLSNLLKMEAQGYRDSQAVATVKATPTKKKIQQELQSNYDNMNKEHIGALAMLSKKAVDRAAAELKTTNFGPPVFNVQKEQRTPNVFARPMLPKNVRGEKVSPKKDNTEEVKDVASSNKASKVQEAGLSKSIKSENVTSDKSTMKPNNSDDNATKNGLHDVDSNARECSNTEVKEISKQKLNIPAVVPIKFRRQSLELMKNPIINKNISEFSKAGMKTKILLIKPINRNKDGMSPNTPLKFQTIKLKEPSKGLANDEDKSSDQIVVVKVPKVNRSVSRNAPDNISDKRLLKATRIETTSSDTSGNKIAAEKTVCPITDSNKKTTEKLDVSNERSISTNVKSSDEQVVTTNSNPTECVSSHSSNNDKIGCGIQVSSKIAEDNNIPEPMDIEETRTDISDIYNGSASEDISTTVNSTISNKVPTNMPGLGDQNNKNLELCDNVETNDSDKEICVTKNTPSLPAPKDSLSSETKVITNGDVGS